MSKINITASDIENFKYISERLDKLPDNIKEQIVTAKHTAVGIECTIRDNFEDGQRINLPNSVSQISDFGEYIGIYCDKYFFKIEGDLYKKKLNYVFIKCDL